MKISELKQPYRRMAEYLASLNISQKISYGIYNLDKRGGVMELFCNEIDKGNYPEITEEIKKHFPTDFDFSGEEKNPLTETSFTDLEPIAENLHKQIYTKLAKEGRFDELPETCEFSELVELEVWEDDFLQSLITTISGKFKGKYVSKNFLCWKNAQLLPPKIDFLQFKSGDIVEVELVNNETRIGWFDYFDNNHVVINVLKRKGNQITAGGSNSGSKMFNKEKIKSITKIK